MTRTTEPRVASFKRLHIPSKKETVGQWNEHHCLWADVDPYDVKKNGMPISKALMLVNNWNSMPTNTTWRYSVAI